LTLTKPTFATEGTRSWFISGDDAQPPADAHFPFETAQRPESSVAICRLSSATAALAARHAASRSAVLAVKEDW